MTDYTSKRQHTVFNKGYNWTLSSYSPGDTAVRNSSGSGIPFTASTVFDSRSGGDLPRWRDIIKAGGNATTSFSGTAWSDPIDDFVSAAIEAHWFDSLGRPGSYRYDFGGSILSCTHPIQGTPTAAQMADVRNRCIRRFNDHVDSVQTSFESGQDLGEYKETLHSIQQPLAPLRDKILSYLGDVKKRSLGSRKNPASIPRVIADTYLEWHFGWQPLVEDVAQAIADCERTRFPTIPVHGSASVTYQSAVTRQGTGLPGSTAGCIRSFRDTSVYSLRYKGAIRTKSLASNGKISLARAYQLTPDKWLPTVWDLLPYSWMADYFVNIGQVIRGLSALSTDLAWSCRTERNQTTRSYLGYEFGDPVKFGITAPSNFGGYGSILGATGDMWTRTVGRSALNSIDLMPTVQFSVPTSKYAYANMGSVLLQRAKPVTKLVQSLYRRFL